MAANVTTADVWEDSGATCMARVLGTNGAVITQAVVSSIAGTLTNTTAGTSVTLTVVVATAVFDTLQTDARWTADSTGYNFLYTISAANLATPAITYRAEFAFTPTSGEVYHVVFSLKTKALYRS